MIKELSRVVEAGRLVQQIEVGLSSFLGAVVCVEPSYPGDGTLRGALTLVVDGVDMYVSPGDDPLDAIQGIRRWVELSLTNGSLICDLVSWADGYVPAEA